MPELEKAWTALQNLVLLRPIRSLADFERVHALADEVRDDVSHSLFSMFDLAMELMQRWEDEHVALI